MPTYDCTLPKVRVYKGARYVPKFADPLQWDSDMEYEWLTVVYDCGRTWISKKPVPSGQALPEYPKLQNDYWALYADYNVQLEHYREEVRSFSLRYDKMFCWLKEKLEALEKLVEQYHQEFLKHVEKFNQHVQEFNEYKTQNDNRVTNLETKVEQNNTKIEQTLQDIINKIYKGGTINPDTGAVTFPTSDKIAIGTINVLSSDTTRAILTHDGTSTGDIRSS